MDGTLCDRLDAMGDALARGFDAIQELAAMIAEAEEPEEQPLGIPMADEMIRGSGELSRQAALIVDRLKERFCRGEG